MGYEVEIAIGHSSGSAEMAADDVVVNFKRKLDWVTEQLTEIGRLDLLNNFTIQLRGVNGAPVPELVWQAPAGETDPAETSSGRATMVCALLFAGIVLVLTLAVCACRGRKTETSPDFPHTMV